MRYDCLRVVFVCVFRCSFSFFLVVLGRGGDVSEVRGLAHSFGGRIRTNQPNCHSYYTRASLSDPSLSYSVLSLLLDLMTCILAASVATHNEPVQAPVDCTVTQHTAGWHIRRKISKMDCAALQAYLLEVFLVGEIFPLMRQEAVCIWYTQCAGSGNHQTLPRQSGQP
jgi:hypothetical protein